MRAWFALALIVPLAIGAQTLSFGESDPNRGHRDQGPVDPPDFPNRENYLQFQVSATTPFAFYVDAKSISIGTDGAVRYTLVATSAGGGVNISYEGMRCVDGVFRVYAYGRSDHAWSKLKKSQWTPIGGSSRNSARAVLYRDFFCPVGSSISSTEDAVRVLRAGGNPRGNITD